MNGTYIVNTIFFSEFKKERKYLYGESTFFVFQRILWN